MLNEWIPVSFSDQVKSILSVTTLSRDIILWNYAGRILAFNDLCPHRSAKLSLGKVIDGEIECPYHGWRFDHNGELVLVPSLGKKINVKLTKYNTLEKYGIVWISISHELHEIPFVSEWEKEDFRKIRCGPYVINANPFRVMENLMDVSHFPFVHSNYLGDPKFPQIPEYEVEKNYRGEIIAKNILVWQPNPDGTTNGRFFNYTYKVLTPFVLYFKKEDKGNVFSMLFAVNPVSKDKSIVYAWIFMNYAHQVDPESIRKFEDEIINQDKKVLESQPKEYYLDLRKEISVKADKLSIFYRRMLRERLGVMPELGLTE
ncbi:aromatic ring-hydroxylating oxygenase subunit alpha [Stygiolobus caldivivus]|uniref:Chlorophyll a oxygenase n=1 Tax=Stygiolobus caldivivus TaxID=2824673 RepID=A0A8D5ZKT2_9CREN|nr:aromatic ring-hydroxylating dioxygenase subunit alpha [Stygiolobus caldivivus]BCU71597.1 chlorophyll a oxygenase [Stygiolobus caldivivus]